MDDKRREFVELDLPPKAVLALQRRFGRRWREAVAAALEAEGSRLGAEMGPPAAAGFAVSAARSRVVSGCESEPVTVMTVTAPHSDLAPEMPVLPAPEPQSPDRSRTASA